MPGLSTEIEVEMETEADEQTHLMSDAQPASTDSGELIPLTMIPARKTVAGDELAVNFFQENPQIIDNQQQNANTGLL